MFSDSILANILYDAIAGIKARYGKKQAGLWQLVSWTDNIRGVWTLLQEFLLRQQS